jgi:predicted Zn-dependent peptidase
MMAAIFDTGAENAFDEKTVKQEKQSILDAIEAFVNDKRRYASARCEQATARGTNFEIFSLGDKEGLEKVTPESLYEYYKSMITSSVIDIYICGVADEKTAEEVVKKYTDNLTFTKSEIPETDIIVRNETDLNEITEEMNVTQGKLSIGFLTNIKPTDEESYALSVFNSIFGAGAHSKLFNNVREKLSLAYYAQSQLSKYKGMIIVNAGIEFENFKKAYDETLVQLKEIQNGNISEHEFSSSVNAIINSYNSYYDDQRAMAMFCLGEKISGRNITLEEAIRKVKKVTIDDVVAVSKKIQLDTVYFLKGVEEK